MPDSPPVTSPIAPKAKFTGLEAGRGFAAIFVLISHCATIIAEPRFYGTVLFDHRLEKLGAGVDFFFVLSGFIISWAHWRDIGRPDRLGSYAQRRFQRIYPPYWAVLIPLTLAYLAFPHAGEPSQHDPWNILFSFALLPYPAHPVLGVAWTLVYEMIFYAVFAVAILKGRRALWLLPAWAAAAIVASFFAERLAFPFTILLDTLNLEFLLGVGAAWILRRHSIRMAPLLMILGWGGFLLLMLSPIPVAADPLMMRLGYGIAAAIGILGTVETERGRGLSVPRVLRVLGAASYAIYLVHGVAISFGSQVLIRLAPRSIPIGFVLAALIAIGIAAGLAFHVIVEKPLTRWIGRHRRAAPVSQGQIS